MRLNLIISVGMQLLLHETGRFLRPLYDWAKVSNRSRLCPLQSLAAGLFVPRPWLGLRQEQIQVDREEDHSTWYFTGP